MKMRRIFGVTIVIGILSTPSFIMMKGALASQGERPVRTPGQLRPRAGADRPARVQSQRPEPAASQQPRRVPPPQEQAQTPALNRIAIIRLLNLSPEQLRRIQEVRRRFGPQLEQLRQQVQDRRDALRQATYGDTFDPTLLEQRIRELIETQSELIRLETQLEVEFRHVLTPEQLAEFRQIQNEELAIRRMRREAREREQRLQERLRRALQRPPQM